MELPDDVPMTDAEAEEVLLALGGGPLSKKAKTILQAAGWTPNRAVDISQTKADLESWGYQWNTSAETFLCSFGNLLPRYNNVEFYFINSKHDF